MTISLVSDITLKSKVRSCVTDHATRYKIGLQHTH